MLHHADNTKGRFQNKFNTCIYNITYVFFSPQIGVKKVKSIVLSE